MPVVVLSPTRTYAPVINVFDKLRSQIHGMVHCLGGACNKSYALRREQACNQGQSLPYPTVIPHDSGTERYGLERDVQGIQYGTPDGDIHRSRAYGRSNRHLKKAFGIDVQIVGFVEEADKNELIIESEKGRFTY